MVNHAAFEAARQARDPRFDGRFFIGVKTTGVYCRPICPVRIPRPENVSFFLTAAGAAEAGYRPCLRCRPESSPGTPAWRGTSTTVHRAIKLIEEGALDELGIDALSDRLGVTSRHLHRLFIQHLGASPNSVAQTRRLHTAKKLIDESHMPMTDIALAAGYGSVRRFNDHIRRVYGRSPTELRGKGRRPKTPIEGYQFRLSYRPPFDFEALLSFLRVRAIPAVESVADGSYTRTFHGPMGRGCLVVSDDADNHQLMVAIKTDDSKTIPWVLDRIRNLFDLGAIPEEVNRVLEKDTVLKPLVSSAPGQRLPGCFDPFEIAVRALVGQQISVKGATTVMGRIAESYGSKVNDEPYFPTPFQLARLAPENLPMPGSRARAIQLLSEAIDRGDISLDEDSELLKARLLTVKGIGPWTAEYIAMRVSNDPDAFLSTDLVIKKVAGRLYGVTSEPELLALAEHWRPWRAYGAMHLWRHASLLEN